MNGDDSGRFPTRGEGVRVPGPVKKEKEGGVVLAQAGALVKGRQSGQGGEIADGRGEIADGCGEFSQGEGGAERIMEGRSILTASFPEFIHELSFSSARGKGCRLR